MHIFDSLYVDIVNYILTINHFFKFLISKNLEFLVFYITFLFFIIYNFNISPLKDFYIFQIEFQINFKTIFNNFYANIY